MTLADFAKEAMFEGVDARRDGKPFSTCPHPHGTRDGNHWRDGWRGEDRMIRSGLCERQFDAMIDEAVGCRE